MKQFRVKDLMIPLGEYATVGENATLQEAVRVLKEAQRKYLEKTRTSQEIRYPHRAVLVLDDEGRVVGKVSQLDVLRALEPRYARIMDSSSVPRVTASGFSAEFLEDLIERYELFSSGLRDLCQKAAERKVRDFMYTPQEGEYVREEDTLDRAVHKLVMGQHQSLLVLNGKEEIVGILRLVDVFEVIASEIEACPIQ
ncbi:CBS domain-containing protein [Thermodesulforhabdus norvegica]|uniref:CBS domain-containing protein n=1 Tax=Thermodesulforhabdus norvegica TaxID=39841 RepID=A0A1I4SGY5_9BACT|nr:CBS domain-containing protein [Thermodesulforhabdus norvegica]SFM63674.1 CBS domain-containing protein [Thermodesulforhabdus norvegica]